ncbi:MAG TPA: sigma-70 family RNA polymerase sigma factor [Quisquiliibacterium sp.]|nr:sigma-70 family RNA polymerase sigma factor [Quisquiliibacterium sp.]HPA91311.1 sigma-70 family RNA polymerase sigma factor [Quisquiliibacterium sp.]HQD83102.1 sigma-70 family RNA polymerase sigma factor [Quisquiliibacterium sp.]HQN14000.1 sigma-70 family RNA polymerase sigma factor [Quisquiliibacterium sp.]HQP66094.1 sigma-70 family RNA polymerase sigma factor [Quisquiliibacterium sp.]
MSIATMDTVAVATTALATVTALEFAAHRSAMLRFARRKIRDEDLAEDAVQDALAAALASRDSFQGKSALRTWLIGILNHKIQDVFRRESRYVRQNAHEGADGEPGGEDPLAEALAAVAAAEHTDPAREVSRRRMRDALLLEIEALPPTLKDVFVMQVIENVPTDEVCRRLQITEANCWVRLHRARKRLAERMRDHLD